MPGWKENGARACNQPRMRRMNEVGILHMLRVRGPLSRRDLARGLELDAKTLTNLGRDLIARGFIERVGMRSEGRGRPHELLRICGGRLQAVGLHVEENRITGALVSLDGKLSLRRQVGLSGAETTARLVGRIREITRRLVREAGGPVMGTGITFPGILDYSSRTIVSCAHLPRWEGVCLDDVLRNGERVPLAAMNYTGAKALAEHWFGAARDTEDFLLIDAGEGIGCALVNGGRVQRGRRHQGGELGHTVADPRGGQCACGRRGCLETVASLGAMLGRAGIAGTGSGSRAALDALALRLDANEPRAVAAVREAGRALGLAVANVINVTAPSRVVLTGLSCELGECFTAQVQSAIADYTVPEFGRALRIAQGSLGPEAALLGAAVLILQAGFEP